MSRNTGQSGTRKGTSRAPNNYSNTQDDNKGIMKVFTQEELKKNAIKAAAITVTAGVVNFAYTKLFNKGLGMANTGEGMVKVFLLSGVGLVAHDAAMERYMKGKTQ